MKFYYDSENDSLYIDLGERPSMESQEMLPGIVMDFDADGKLVGIDIDHASKIVNLSRFEAESFPIPQASSK